MSTHDKEILKTEKRVTNITYSISWRCAPVFEGQECTIMIPLTAFYTKNPSVIVTLHDRCDIRTHRHSFSAQLWPEKSQSGPNKSWNNVEHVNFIIGALLSLESFVVCPSELNDIRGRERVSLSYGTRALSRPINKYQAARLLLLCSYRSYQKMVMAGMLIGCTYIQMLGSIVDFSHLLLIVLQ